MQQLGQNVLLGPVDRQKNNAARIARAGAKRKKSAACPVSLFARTIGKNEYKCLAGERRCLGQTAQVRKRKETQIAFFRRLVARISRWRSFGHFLRDDCPLFCSTTMRFSKKRFSNKRNPLPLWCIPNKLSETHNHSRVVRVHGKPSKGQKKGKRKKKTEERCRILLTLIGILLHFNDIGLGEHVLQTLDKFVFFP